MLVDYNLIGKRFAAARKEKGMTQEKLAEKANLSSNYLSHIETSRSIPSLETFMTLCTTLEVNPDSILLGSAVTQENYLVSDIAQQLAQCTESEKRIVYHLIDAMTKEHTKK